MTDGPGSLFRAEALEHLNEVRLSDGEVFNPVPPALERGVMVLLLAGAALLALLLVARVGEYAVGPSLVRSQGRHAATATSAGTVRTLLLSPGATVEEGTLLMALDDERERAARDRIAREREAALTQYLIAPRRQDLRDTLARLNASLGEAEARLSTREVRSPTAGRLTDVRAVVGQTVAPGDVLAVVETRDGDFRLEAALPGELRPGMLVGQTAEVRLAGYPDVLLRVPLQAIGDEVIGPGEVERLLRPSHAGSFSVEGPRVLVTAPMPSSFESHGRVVPLFDGMVAEMSVRVRHTRLVLVLFPWLHELWR